MGGIVDSTDLSLIQFRERVKDSEACSPRGRKELDTTEQVNNSNKA